MAFRYLDDVTLTAVRKAAIDLGFADDGQVAALTDGIPPAFVAASMQGGTAVARLMTLTGKMNTTRVLLSGTVPLTKWLDNAILLSAGRSEELVFRKALELASADGLADPGESPGGADLAGQAADVHALPRGEAGLEIAIGEDDTLEVGFLHIGSMVSRSVAKLLVHRHFDGIPSILAGNAPDYGNGTGWMIGPGLLITNHHVVNGRLPLEPPATAQDFALQGAATTVQFDFYRSGSEFQQTRTIGCVASDPALDFALLRLPDDAPRRPPLRLRTSPITKPINRALQERVNVLQHPNGDAMRLGFRNNFVVTGSAGRLSYLTDTAGGSSGSPICDDAWFVAALHRGFTTIAGGPVQVWGKSIKQENYGTPIGRILQHLLAEHPALHTEIEAGQAALDAVP